MKKYRTLFFDVDDTLLDFSAAESAALRLLFAEQNMPFSPEIEAHYKRINQGLWKSFEEGNMNQSEVVNTRFSILFKEYGHELDGVSLETKYRGYLEEGHQLITGAFELITGLQHQYDLYIVTNGLAKTQDKRLRASGMHHLFKDIFISETIGFRKPTKEFFDYVFARIPDFSADEALLIGDSLSADIKGGQLAGIDTCWFNPEMKPHDTEVVPTYQIQKLEELYQILQASRGEVTYQ